MPRAFWISLCNLAGLGLSLSGVILLFFYALPPVVPGAPQAITSEGGSLDASRGFNRNAHIGLALVAIGTTMEAAPPFAMLLLVARRRPISPRLRPSQWSDVALYSTDQLRAVYHQTSSDGTPAQIGESRLTRSEIGKIIRYRVGIEERRLYITTTFAIIAAIAAVIAAIFAAA